MLTVHVLKFQNWQTAHIEIFLVEENQNNQTGYYYINPWAYDGDTVKTDSDSIQCFNEQREEASERLQFTLDNDVTLDTIIKAWNEQYFEKYQDEKAHILFRNCADAVTWFLNTYTPYKIPGSFERPVTCDRTFLCFFVPSPLQFFSTPGRVFSCLEEQLKKAQSETRPLLGPATNTMKS